MGGSMVWTRRPEALRRAAPFALSGLAVLAGAGLSAAAQPGSPAAGPAAPAAAGPRQPVDITAEKQEDFNAERRVVYSGNVETVMGQDRMRTPQLTIIFAKKPDAGAPAKSAPAPGGAGAGSNFGKIERMEAEATVFVTTPTQNARGDHGTYLAAPDTITLTGNVVLVQDKNVSTGDRLVIDRKTDHATLYSGNGAQTGRVRGVFYQEQQSQPPAPAAPGKANGRAPS